MKVPTKKPRVTERFEDEINRLMSINRHSGEIVELMKMFEKIDGKLEGRSILNYDRLRGLQSHLQEVCQEELKEFESYFKY